MKKNIFIMTIFIMTIFIATNALCQKQIGNKLYLYGDLTNSVKGKTLIYYGVDDPKGENEIINDFNKNGVESISWNQLFLPDVTYSDIERNQIVSDKDIQTIILIKLHDISTYNYSSSNSSTYYNSWTNSLNTNSNSGNITELANVVLVFEVYTKDNGFNRPVAVINGNAYNSWGLAGTQTGVTLKIVKRVIKAMKNEKAF